MAHIPDFADISDALYAIGVEDDAAEVHGILCGLLCINSEVDYQTWLSPSPAKKMALLDADPQQLPSAETVDKESDTR